MAKSPTAWASKDASSTLTQTSGDLLLENGSYLLLEDGVTRLALEDIIAVPKEDTAYDSVAKPTSAWASKDGSSTLVNIGLTSFRVAQNGTDQRLMQNGTDLRIVNEISVTPKETTQWDSL